MAIYSSIALGTFKKSVGNVTGVILRGQRVAKQKMTTYLDANTATQQAQRAQLTNVVFLWSIMKSFFKYAVSQIRNVESAYNAFVRLFINAVMDTIEHDIMLIAASIDPANYGHGFPLLINAAVCGPTGCIVSYVPESEIYLATGSIRGILLLKNGQIHQATQVLGAAPSTLLIPTADAITPEDVALVAIVASNEMDTISGPVQVLTAE